MKKINKKLYKQVAGKCTICKIPLIEVLEVHRIQFGSQGGEYTSDNIAIICSNCHSLVHKGKIIIDKWYHSTDGRKLRIIENGEEKFL